MEGGKLVIAGLDKAGKSSIIQRVFFSAYPEELDNHKPTRGVTREPVKLTEDQVQFVFWELGGQQQYLQDHTSKPQLFTQTQLLIFVIDIQDDSRYELAIDYLQQLVLLLRENTFNSHVTVILHKFDPTAAVKLRKKQFVLLKLLKSLQESFPSVEFTQHSTSIHDDTLFYTFQNIFQRVGLDIGAYKQETHSKVVLQTSNESESISEVSSVSKEILSRFESILESAKIGSDHIAPEFESLDDIQKLHQVFVKYITEFKEIGSIESKRRAVDAIIISYIEYLAALIISYLKSGKITEKDAHLVLLFVGQLNVIKVRILHYVQNVSTSHITEPLKFMENLKQLTNDLLDASFIMGSYSLDQLEEMKLLINGVTNSNFSLFSSENQNVYTFSRIQELKSAFSQDKFVPAKMIIKIELAEEFKAAYERKIEEILNTHSFESNLHLDSLQTFRLRLEYLILEFYQIVVTENIRDYDMDRVVDQQFHRITLQLLNIGHLANIIEDSEALKIRNIIEAYR